MEVWLYAPKEIMADSGKTEMGIYKRDILRKTERKHAFDQENMLRFKEKERKHDLDQEKKEVAQELDQESSKFLTLTLFVF